MGNSDYLMLAHGTKTDRAACKIFQFPVICGTMQHSAAVIYFLYATSLAKSFILEKPNSIYPLPISLNEHNEKQYAVEFS